MKYIIRKVEISDLFQLVELCYQHALYEKAEYSKTGKENKLRNLFFSENPRLHCLVITIEEKLVGYASYTFDYSTWDAQVFLYLDCLYLEPEFRGWGIGENIFNTLVAIAKANDCINIQWQTPIFNERAIKFYNRMGGLSKEKSRFTFKLT